jgi:hypothetical protein
MIIDDLDVKSVPTLKPEIDPPWIVDPDAPLPHSITFQRLQMIRWGIPKIINLRSRMKLRQPHGCTPQYCRGKLVRFPCGKKSLRFSMCKGAYHILKINYSVMRIKGQPNLLVVTV